MTIDLFTKENRVERNFYMAGCEHYEFFPQHPAYDYLLDVSLSATAMTAAICANKGIEFPDNGYVGLSCKSLDYTVNIPAHATLEYALTVQDPASIPISVEWRRKHKQHSTWAPRISKWMSRSIYSGFVDLYEKNTNSIHKNGKIPGKIGKLLRDSISHKEKITDRSGKLQISWKDISLTEEDIGKDMSDYFLFGDILIVAITMLDRENK